MDDVLTIKLRANENFDQLVAMAEASVRDAVNAPPSEVVGVKSHMGGVEMRVQRVGLIQRFLFNRFV
ncbi:hypothetical protein HHL21_19705 [Massilia sp. RP-1-19]|uniref:Uncharacterized protein n=1 Tax=Massilia polaris TaxID=2728846 RepID=A0A848HUA1_9BURK|nr:hypothetical protein [Massilia polaris]NML63271.1 hypothetical protein [Massilia polaris]